MLHDAGGGAAARNVSTPGRSDRAHVAEDAGDVNNDGEDKIVVLRDAGRGAAAWNEAGTAVVGGPLL